MHDPATQHPSVIVADAMFTTDMYFVTAMITGDMARDLLLYNREPEKGQESTNRKASKVVVNGYAATMVRGQWYLSPQPIVFSQKDVEQMSTQEIEEMIDGQQRLKAVVQASQIQPQIAVPFTLCFDAPSAAKWLLDQGKKRNPGDFLRMAGEENAGRLANALRMLYAFLELQPFKSVNLWRHVSLSPQQQTEFLAKHASLRQGLEVAMSTKTLFQPHVGAVLFYLVASEFGPFVAQELFNGLSTGAELKPFDARLKVREYIASRNAPTRGLKHKWDGFEQLALLITAANAWLIGNEDYRAGSTFNRMSTMFPRLVTKAQMPETRIVPGNDPKIV